MDRRGEPEQRVAVGVGVAEAAEDVTGAAVGLSGGGGGQVRHDAEPITAQCRRVALPVAAPGGFGDRPAASGDGDGELDGPVHPPLRGVVGGRHGGEGFRRWGLRAPEAVVAEVRAAQPVRGERRVASWLSARWRRIRGRSSGCAGARFAGEQTVPRGAYYQQVTADAYVVRSLWLGKPVPGSRPQGAAEQGGRRAGSQG
ncbi:hypothetical protein [Streptomyces sp. NPDC020951]|uniref:hypothetical protein n=1 Tax=Streptomyces sp. NPDC020951 TaxID=3365104 RepID=UPI0037A74D06